jgi:hypothetical protein
MPQKYRVTVEFVDVDDYVRSHYNMVNRLYALLDEDAYLVDIVVAKIEKSVQSWEEMTEE